jgi:shikimate dehydrogenase
LRALHVDAVYVAIRCDAHALAPLMRTLARAGGGGNVTVPHKHSAAQCVERPTAAVLRTGACNTFWADGGALCGDNTDVAGARHALLRLLPGIRDARALVLGAGGAAAAMVCALLDGAAAAISLLNRSPDRAFALRDRLAAGAVISVATSSAQVRGVAFDVVINATSAGLQRDDALPLDLAGVRAAAALDLVYGPGGSTPFVRHALSLGIPAADGTEMLLGQGAEALRRWTGLEPPLAVMREAIGATAMLSDAHA